MANCTVRDAKLIFQMLAARLHPILVQFSLYGIEFRSENCHGNVTLYRIRFFKQNVIIYNNDAMTNFTVCDAK